MRKINLICIGTLKEKFWIEACNEYKKRMSKFFDFNIIEFPEKKLFKNSEKEIEQVKIFEGEQIIKKIKGNQNFIFAIEGEQYSSENFAKLIEKQTDNGEINFIIGGSYGLSDDVKKLGKNISFSKLTFPHQLMRVIVCEQLYRAGTIINNIEYHK